MEPRQEERGDPVRHRWNHCRSGSLYRNGSAFEQLYRFPRGRKPSPGHGARHDLLYCFGNGHADTAAYIIAAAVMVPALVELGLIPLAAHMFVFYFACLSMVTPPVALAAYAAAGIAKSDTWTTGWYAFMLAAGGFVVPFAFAQNPALLLQIESIPNSFGSNRTPPWNLHPSIAMISWAVSWAGFAAHLHPAGRVSSGGSRVQPTCRFCLIALTFLHQFMARRKGKTLAKGIS